MNAVILKWNPEVSSYTIDEHLKGMEHFENFHLNWSVWDYDKIHKWDPFLMVRVGNGNTGIVMSGIVLSEPYKGEDWSGKGRDVYYVDLRITIMVHPESLLVLTTDELLEQIPDFEWTHGHSGVVLSTEKSMKLLNLWELHQENHAADFGNASLVRSEKYEIEPAFKLFCLESFLKGYEYEVHTSADEGYDYLSDLSYCITLKNKDGDELFIDLEGDFTLTYGGWHTHYFATPEDYECLKDDISAILTNKMGTVTYVVAGKCFGGSTTEQPITNKEEAIKKAKEMYGDIKEFMQKIHDEGVELRCRYWNSVLNSNIVIAPNEIPLK